MRRRGRNGANPGMVPPRGRGNASRIRTHGRDALSGDSGSSGGCKSKHDDGSRSRHDGRNRGCRSSGSRSRARVGAVGRGRRIFPHSRSEAVSSARLLGWRRRRDGEEGKMGDFKSDLK